MKKLFYLFVVLTCMASCEKELSLEGAVEVPLPPPIDPEPVDTEPVFQLKAFYSDIPIDFDESDGNSELETDLWKYVLDYLHDDHYVLRNDSTLEVIQNALKMPGMDADVIYRSYSKGEDNAGDYLIYLTADYEQTKYRLYEWSADHFVIGLKWKDGARVYSRFERIK